MLKSGQNSRNAAGLSGSHRYTVIYVVHCLWGSILPLVSLTFLKPVEKKTNCFTALHKTLELAISELFSRQNRE